MTDGSETAGRVAGIDFGTVRIGIAVSDPGRTIASPLETHTRCGLQGDARYFSNLAAEEEIALFVVGLPVHLSGHESQKSIEARAFGQWLEETTTVPVTYYDERLTSKQADEIMREANVPPKRRKGRRDMLAAQLLLAAFLESDPNTPHTPGALED